MVWDADRTKRSEFRGESGIVANSLAWNATGSHLAMTGVNSGALCLWDIEKDELRWQIEAGNVEQVLWSTDGGTLLTTLRGEIVIRDSNTGQELQRLDAVRERFGRMAYSPQANRLAVGSSSSLSLWDIDSKQVAIKFMVEVSGQVIWSPDGKCIAAGCRDGVRLWDARRGYELLIYSKSRWPRVPMNSETSVSPT